MLKKGDLVKVTKHYPVFGGFKGEILEEVAWTETDDVMNIFVKLRFTLIEIRGKPIEADIEYGALTKV